MKELIECLSSIPSKLMEPFSLYTLKKAIEFLITIICILTVIILMPFFDRGIILITSRFLISFFWINFLIMVEILKRADRKNNKEEK